MNKFSKRTLIAAAIAAVLLLICVPAMLFVAFAADPVIDPLNPSLLSQIRQIIPIKQPSRSVPILYLTNFDEIKYMPSAYAKSVSVGNGVSADFSPDKSLIYFAKNVTSGMESRPLEVYDVKQKKVTRFNTGVSDNTVQVVNFASLQNSNYEYVIFQMQLTSRSGEWEYRVYKLSNGKEVAKFKAQHDVLMAKGNYVWYSQLDGEIKVLDLNHSETNKIPELKSRQYFTRLSIAQNGKLNTVGYDINTSREGTVYLTRNNTYLKMPTSRAVAWTYRVDLLTYSADGKKIAEVYKSARSADYNKHKAEAVAKIPFAATRLTDEQKAMFNERYLAAVPQELKSYTLISFRENSERGVIAFGLIHPDFVSAKFGDPARSNNSYTCIFDRTDGNGSNPICLKAAYLAEV